MPAVEGAQMDDLLLQLAFARGGGPKKQAKQKPAWNDAVEAVVSAYGGKKKPKPPKQAPSRWKAAPRPGRKPLAPKRNARPAKKRLRRTVSRRLSSLKLAPMSPATMD